MATYVMALRYLKDEPPALCLTEKQFSNTQSFRFTNQYNIYEREKKSVLQVQISGGVYSMQRKDSGMHLLTVDGRIKVRCLVRTSECTL